MTGDDEMAADPFFEGLLRSMSPPLREPPVESVAALHAAVARRFGGQPSRPWWRQKVAVGAAVFGLVAGAPAAAFAVGGAPLPDPLRTALHACGLPVDSVPIASAKAAEAHLRDALRTRDQSEVREDAARLRATLAALDGGDRSRLGPNAEALLLAAAVDGSGGQESAGSAGTQASQGPRGEHGGSSNGGESSGPGTGSSIPTGSGGDGSSQPAGSQGGSGDGDETTTTPAATTATSTTVPSVSGGGDGDQADTTTTTVSTQGQSDSGATTTTTVQANTSSDGGG